MTRQINFMNAINEALDQAMEKDENVILLWEDIHWGTAIPHLEEQNEDAWGGVFGVTKGLGPKYGLDRVIDTPLSEMGFLGVAVGMEATGFWPVQLLIFIDFFGFSFDSLPALRSFNIQLSSDL